MAGMYHRKISYIVWGNLHKDCNSILLSLFLCLLKMYTSMEHEEKLFVVSILEYFSTVNLAANCTIVPSMHS